MDKICRKKVAEVKITMLGVGNGFSKGIYNNNAIVRHEAGQYALIDCGITAWASLDLLGIAMEDISSIYISHLHFDHSGGIEAAAIYGTYFTGKKYRLIAPKPIMDCIWEGCLKCAIGNEAEGKTNLEDFFEVVTPSEGEDFPLCNGITARWFQTKHHTGKFSAGLVLNGKVAFTSDMVCDVPLLEKLVSQGVEVIYHDCQMKNGIHHADYTQLTQYPAHLKEKLYLMHHGLQPSQVPQGDLKFLQQHQQMVF